LTENNIKTDARVILFYFLLFLTPFLASANFQLIGGEKVALFIWLMLVVISWGTVTISKEAGFRELIRFKPLIPLFLLILWVVISVPFSQVMDASVKIGVNWLAAILLPLMAVQLRLKKAQVYNSLLILTVSAGVLSLYGIYQAVWGFTALATTPGLSADDLVLLSGAQRPFSFFPSPNVFGGFLLPFVPVSILLFLKSDNKIIKFSVIGLLVTILIGLVFSYSRGAMLVGLISFCLIATVLFMSKYKKAIIALGIVIVLAIPLFLVLQSSVDSSQDQLKQSVGGKLSTLLDKGNMSVVGRLSYWKTAINMGNDNFFMGGGLGTFKHVSRKYQQEANYVTNPHNIVLKIYAEMGLVGVVIFLLFVFGVLWTVFRLYRQKGDIEPALLGVAFIAMLLHGLIDLDFNSPSFLSLFILLGVFILYEDLPESKKSGKLDPLFKVLTVTLIVVVMFVCSFFPLISYKYGKEARAARDANALGKALELAEDSVGFWPFDPVAHYRLSRLAMEKYNMSANQQDLQKAVTAVQLAILANPSNPEFYLGLADIFSMTGRGKDILATIQKSADLYPASVFYNSEYARALSQSGQIDKALEILDRVLDFEDVYLANNNPNGMDLVRARFLKASILAENSRYQQAKNECEKILLLLDKPNLVLKVFTSSRASKMNSKQLRKEAKNFMNELDTILNKNETVQQNKGKEDEQDK